MDILSGGLRLLPDGPIDFFLVAQEYFEDGAIGSFDGFSIHNPPEGQSLIKIVPKPRLFIPSSGLGGQKQARLFLEFF